MGGLAILENRVVGHPSSDDALGRSTTGPIEAVRLRGARRESQKQSMAREEFFGTASSNGCDAQSNRFLK